MPARTGVASVVAIAALCLATIGLAARAEGQSVSVSIALEFNATDGDAKVLASCASREPMQRLVIRSPDGRAIADLIGTPRVPDQSAFEIEAEAAGVEALLEEFPEGRYSFEIHTKRQIHRRMALLSHAVPGAPAVAPADEAVLEPDDAELRWEPVEGATRFIVEIEQGVRRHAWQVDADTHSVALPTDLERGREIALDVIAVGENGNRIVAESSFYIAPERGARVPDGEFRAKGMTPWLRLEPGFQTVLEGPRAHRLECTVLGETRFIEGILTRVFEERESRAGELVRVARKYLALHVASRDLYCFGEEVDSYAGGVVIDRHRVANPTPWVFLPAEPSTRSGARAPRSAVRETRVRAAGILPVLDLASGSFEDVLVVAERAPPSFATTLSYFASGLGLVKRNDLEVIVTGFIDTSGDEEEDDDEEE